MHEVLSYELRSLQVGLGSSWQAGALVLEDRSGGVLVQEWVRPQLIILRSPAVTTGVYVRWQSPEKAAALQSCCVK